MTKSDLAQMLFPRNGGLTHRDALRLVDLLFDIVKRHLKKGESIHFVGFGTFEIVIASPGAGEIQSPVNRYNFPDTAPWSLDRRARCVRSETNGGYAWERTPRGYNHGISIEGIRIENPGEVVFQNRGGV